MKVDIERLKKDIEDILSVKRDIANLLDLGTDNFLADKRNSLALKYLLVEAVEAICDVCQHVLAKSKGIACNGYVDCIIKAGENNIISHSLSNKLKGLANLRNSLIHRYRIIKDDELYNSQYIT